MIKLNLQLPVSVFKEGKHFIAYTPVLDLSTSGKNYEEVKKRFKESVSIFFEELVKKGTMDEVLESLGKVFYFMSVVIMKEKKAITGFTDAVI